MLVGPKASLASPSAGWEEGRDYRSLVLPPKDISQSGVGVRDPGSLSQN